LVILFSGNISTTYRRENVPFYEELLLSFTFDIKFLHPVCFSTKIIILLNTYNVAYHFNSYRDWLRVKTSCAIHGFERKLGFGISVLQVIMRLSLNRVLLAFVLLIKKRELEIDNDYLSNRECPRKTESSNTPAVARNYQISHNEKQETVVFCSTNQPNRNLLICGM
jgi:hypothetical protein